MPDPSRTESTLRALKDIGDRAAIWVRRLLGLLLIAMVLLNVGNAIGRYVFRRSIDGADEILIFAMAWLVFIGAAVVTW
ncbi:MAG: TRAP transporter small permease subunit, partial [Kiloniellales bacterium]|nr:TRAP transporter small permease subunit [Kiloniellales bacterium]